MNPFRRKNFPVPTVSPVVPDPPFPFPEAVRNDLELDQAATREVAVNMFGGVNSEALPTVAAVKEWVSNEADILARRRSRRKLPCFLGDGSRSHLTVPLRHSLSELTLIFRLTVPPVAPGSDVGLAAISNSATIPTLASGGTHGANAVIAFFATNGDLVIRKYNAAMNGNRDAVLQWSALSPLAGQDICVAVQLHADGSAPAIFLDSTDAESTTPSTSGTEPPEDFGGFASDHLHLFGSLATMNRMRGPLFGEIVVLGSVIPVTRAAAQLALDYSIEQAMADEPLSPGAARGLLTNGAGASYDLNALSVSGSATVASVTATSATNLVIPAGSDFRRNGGSDILFDSTLGGLRIKFTVANFAVDSGTPVLRLGYMSDFLAQSSPINADGDYDIVLPRSTGLNARLAFITTGSGSLSFDLSNWSVLPLGAIARLSAVDMVNSNSLAATIADRSGSGNNATAIHVQRLN